MCDMAEHDQRWVCAPRGDEESLSERIGLPLSATRVFCCREADRYLDRNRNCTARLAQMGKSIDVIS